MGTWFVGGSEPWGRITGRVAATKGRVLAAIAFVGADAPTLLPLKEGDVLVCDASRRTVRAGSTSAKALQRFSRDGVRIYSHRALHAKVVVLPRRVFVGSTNASANSRDNLDEATLETTDTEAVNDARAFVKAMSSGDAEAFRLDDDDIRALLKIPVDQRGPESVFELPTEVPHLGIWSMSRGDWASSTLQSFEEEKDGNTRILERMGAGLSLDAIEWDNEQPMPKKGDWFIGIYPYQWVHPPAKVTNITKSSKKWSIIWLAKPRGAKARRLSELDHTSVNSVHTTDDSEVIEGTDTTSILSEFRKPD